jgi:AcrR family transcriptional regulator
MDAVAGEAGTGKGTLFRAFGSREGLLNALWARELADLRERVENGGPPLGPGAPAIDRASAFLEALLVFKLKNRFLIRALELGPGVLQSEHYRWMKMTLQRFIAAANLATSANRASYAAHVLLSAMHIDLVEEMIASGHSLKSIKLAQKEHLKAVIKSVG